jgi:GDP-L-fucose synthase
MTTHTKVLVTGATGFLGRHLVPVLQQRYGCEGVVGVSRRDYNLLDRAEVDRMLDELRPETLIHLAAFVGGIGVNRARPADFYYENTLLTAHTFQAAAEHGVKKLIYTMGGCSYPATATSPIDEDQMWSGYPQADSAAYSSAKKMGIVASDAYQAQWGLQSVVLVPGNVYGPYDNFRTSESHVIPATIRRFVEARQADVPEVVMWGSGVAQRDFVYAGDVAATIPFFIDTYDQPGPVNLSTGTTTSIRELAELVKELTGFRGDIRWDTTKPDGQLVKIFGVQRMRALGLSCGTPLLDGLRCTIDWFERNRASGGDGIRL